MSYSISTLLTRNLHDVFGENDPVRRRAAVDEIFTGRFQKYDPPLGQALMSATTQTGKVISAQYATKATFENGDATVTLGLIKHGDQWQILRFNVNSPQLIPK
jgi:hypothetical protein